MICLGYITFWLDGSLRYVTHRLDDGSYFGFSVSSVLEIDSMPLDLRIAFENMDKSIYKF